jgi:hypothetical protein
MVQKWDLAKDWTEKNWTGIFAQNLIRTECFMCRPSLFLLVQKSWLQATFSDWITSSFHSMVFLIMEIGTLWPIDDVKEGSTHKKVAYLV